MDAAVKFAGLSLIQQYLRTEQGVVEFSDAKPGDLVEAMPFLLQVVNRQTEALVLAKQELQLEADEVWNAAVRLLKNIYFADANDEYQVLGLNPWCSISEARERYRYLIRLFHPDRGMLSSLGGEPDFAAIINRAYTNISNSNGSPIVGKYAAGTRQNYSPKFKLGTQFGSKFKPKGQIHMAAVAAALGIYKLTPRSVWLVLIIISLTFIAQKYWVNQYQAVLVGPLAYKEQPQTVLLAENTVQKVSPVAEKPAPIAIESNSPKIASEAVSSNINQPAVIAVTNPVVTLSKEADSTNKSLAVVTRQQVAVSPNYSQTLHTKTLPKANDLNVQKEITKTVTFIEPDKSVQKSAPVAKENINQTKNFVPSESQSAQKTAQKPIPVKAVNPQVKLADASQQISESAKFTGNAVINNAAINKEQLVNSSSPSAAVDAERKTAANVVHVSNAVVRTTELSNEELDRLIKSLIASYNKGDLETFMQLLEDEVKTDEPGGKNGLRLAYAKLFSKTTQREIQLKDLNWQRNGEIASTSPKYVVSVTSATASEPKIHRGVLQFEVVRREGRPIIHAFYHLPEGSER